MTEINAQEKTESRELSPLMKFATELGPLLAFFVLNAQGERLAEAFPVLEQFGGSIFIATAGFMLAMVISLTFTYVMIRKIPIMPLVTGVFVLFFGGLTLFFHNDTFIKMKPTIVNVFFSASLFVGLMFGKSLLEYIFNSIFIMDKKGWRILTWRWTFFFLFLALINEIVWRNFSTDFWVNFKVFAVMPMTMAFMLFQMRLVGQHGYMVDPSKKKDAENP